MSAAVVPESRWREKLIRVPAWIAPRRDTFVIAPHPDDETLGVGGIIATLCDRGVPVSVIAVTDGEASYGEADSELARTRRAEQEAALGSLGVARERIHRLSMPDSGVADREAELTAHLCRLIQPGSHVIAPWTHDFHPDHEACGRAAQAAAETSGSVLTYWLFWTWIHGSLDLLENRSVVRLPLSPAVRERKEAALRCHRSQLSRPGGGPPILPPDLLGSARRPFEAFFRT